MKPKTPTSLRVTQDPIAGLALAWKAPTDYDLAGYTIYRNFTNSSSTGWALLDNVTVDAAGPSPTFRDTSAPRHRRSIASPHRLGRKISSISSTISGVAHRADRTAIVER